MPHRAQRSLIALNITKCDLFCLSHCLIERGSYHPYEVVICLIECGSYHPYERGRLGLLRINTITKFSTKLVT
eukprot:scaffold118126_cov56-Attheya_sp.AAC.6